MYSCSSIQFINLNCYIRRIYLLKEHFLNLKMEPNWRMQKMKERKTTHLVLTSYPHKHEHLECWISWSSTNFATYINDMNPIKWPQISVAALYQCRKYRYCPGLRVEWACGFDTNAKIIPVFAYALCFRLTYL